MRHSCALLPTKPTPEKSSLRGSVFRSHFGHIPHHSASQIHGSPIVVVHHHFSCFGSLCCRTCAAVRRRCLVAVCVKCRVRQHVTFYRFESCRRRRDTRSLWKDRRQSAGCRSFLSLVVLNHEVVVSPTELTRNFHSSFDLKHQAVT